MGAARPARTVLALVLAGPVVVLGWFWERVPPWWLGLIIAGAAVAFWCLSIVWRGRPTDVFPAALALSVLSSHVPRHRAIGALAPVVVVCLPLLLAVAVSPGQSWQAWFVAAVVGGVAGAAVVHANHYAWRLFLQLDQARNAERQLAIVQERYRFATDLHDIQGHTLHVIRLTMQLARREIPTDPDAAIEHLRDAEALVVQTLAETRNLATGDRVVALPHELANAEAIVTAAGIRWHRDGEPEDAADELLALLLREATTNLLRHAQATEVRVVLSPGLVQVSNDGAGTAVGSLSGLASLAERFAARGGELRTELVDGRFTVSGRLP